MRAAIIACLLTSMFAPYAVALKCTDGHNLAKMYIRNSAEKGKMLYVNVKPQVNYHGFGNKNSLHYSLNHMGRIIPVDKQCHDGNTFLITIKNAKGAKCVFKTSLHHIHKNWLRIKWTDKIYVFSKPKKVKGKCKHTLDEAGVFGEYHLLIITRI